MRGLVRKAFMQHPAATDADFRQCWPSIRQELLKKYTLEELEANPEGLDEIISGLGREKGAELRLVTKSKDSGS
jgi:hypothetical protein